MVERAESDWERPPASWTQRAMRGAQLHGPGVVGRAVRVMVWSIVHFCASLAQQLAELLAPLLLIVGIGWYVLPRVIGLIQTDDGQVRDIVAGVQSHVPSQLVLAGHTLTASGLIVDGIALMVIAAALSTATTVIGNELYRGR